MEKYDVDYFIKKFEAIPVWKWTVGVFTRKKLKGLLVQHCALGHCGGRAEDMGYFKEEANALYNISKTYAPLMESVMSINDGTARQYKQATAKERVLAWLYDVKARQEAVKKKEEVKVIEKERIVYVTVDEKVRELQEQELVLN